MSAAPDDRADVAKRPAFEPPASLTQPVVSAPTMARPVATMFGVAIVVLRVIAGVVWLIAVALQWDDLVRGDGGVVLETAADLAATSRAVLAILLVGGGVVLAIDLLLAVLVWFGSNAARIAVMLISTLSITASWVESLTGDIEITVQTTFITLALDILLLLALSSRASRAYARRPRARRGRRGGHDPG